MLASSPRCPFARPALLLAFSVLMLIPGPATSRPPDDLPQGPGLRVDEFAGWYHSAGSLLLHMSNRGRFGRAGNDLTNPSGEWPGGTDHEYLFGAGLWVAGVVNRGSGPDTLCSSGLFQPEFRNFEANEGCGTPPIGICESFEGAPAGLRLFDDDGDGLTDEDPLNGEDDDGDGRVDEDFAGISQEMFRTVTYDTSTAFNVFFPSEADQHRPMGLRVEQESYQWTDPQFDDLVGVEFRIRNISASLDEAELGWSIDNAYIGFMVDADVGLDTVDDISADDQVGFAALDTVLVSPAGDSRPLSLTMGYMYDEPGVGGDDVPGYLGVLFLGHTVDTVTVADEDAIAPRTVGIHRFKTFSRGAEDPRDDRDRYQFLRGNSDVVPTLDAGSTTPRDYRFLVSAGPFATIAPGSTLTFQVAFVAGEMTERVDPETGVLRRVPDLTNPIQAQRVYDGFLDPGTGEIVHWATSSPPPPPALRVTPGDGSVVIEWDDHPERTQDPLTRELDFAGYQVWKAEGWRRESNVPSDAMWRIVADFDTTELADVDTGFHAVGRYRYVDTRVENGFWYWYAVTAYDRGEYRTEIDFSTSPPETTLILTSSPKFGRPTQNMTRVMPRTTPTQLLDDVYVAPNPYRGDAAWDLAQTQVEPTGRRIKFFNLPRRATVRIFTLAGDLVTTIEHDAAFSTAQPSWNLVSRNNQDTVSGIYLYHVSTPDGAETTGKFVVIR